MMQTSKTLRLRISSTIANWFVSPRLYSSVSLVCAGSRRSPIEEAYALTPPRPIPCLFGHGLLIDQDPTHRAKESRRKVHGLARCLFSKRNAKAASLLLKTILQ